MVDEQYVSQNFEVDSDYIEVDMFGNVECHQKDNKIELLLIVYG